MRVIRTRQLLLAFFVAALSGCSGNKAAQSPGDAGVDSSLAVPDADQGGVPDGAPDYSVGIETSVPAADQGGAGDSASDQPVAVEASVPDVDHGDANDGASDGIAEASVPDADHDEASAAPCSTPLDGTEPFGVHLEGRGALYHGPFPPAANQPYQASLALDIYFPGGRVAGAPVLLAMPVEYAVPALQVSAQSVLAADLSATGLNVSGGLGVRVTGTLLPLDDGLSAAVEENIAFATDVEEMVTGALKLCPTGPAPVPGLTVLSRNDFPSLRSTSTPVQTSLVAPTSTVLLKPSTPIDPEALAKIRLYASDAEIPVSVRVGTDIESSPLLLSANAAFPPETPLRLDTTAVTDVLGRPVPCSSFLSPLTTTAVVSDLTFATAPTGAVATTGTSLITDGKLSLRGLGLSTSFYALLALGSVAPATQARLRIGVVCTQTTSVWVRANLVGAAGDSVAVPLACGSPQDVFVPLPPSTGKIWLSVVSEPQAPHPQYLNPPSANNQVEIDEIAFE
jgi:hypothetical protein